MRKPVSVRRASALGIVLLSATDFLGCGGPANPDDVDFPVSSTSGNRGCTSTAPTIYMVIGLADHVVDASAPTLEARLRVGERVELFVTGYGCGSYTGGTWSSTNPSAASIVPDNPFTFVAYLTGAAPGQTRVFATFKADDRKTYRTTLAYCAPVGENKNASCSDPRRIDVVTVVTP
jgi:hypothetical protein